MTGPDVRGMTSGERARLADHLADLAPDQWGSPSLCGAWTVHDVVAHLVAAASTGPLPWVRNVLVSRFDFDVHNARLVDRHRGATPAETLDRFRAVVPSRTSTWGPPAAWLGEVVVHGQDILRPLGVPWSPDPEAIRVLAEFTVSRDFTVPGKKLSTGLHLVGDDGAFDHGSGPRVTGPTLSLVMALSGRPAFLDDLAGDGLPQLRDRLATA